MAVVKSLELVSFVSLNEEVIIGKDNRNVLEEAQRALGICAKVLYKGTLLDVVANPQSVSATSRVGQKLLMKVAEMSADEISEMKLSYKGLVQTAVKKILWLNTMSEKLTGETFIEGIVNINDLYDCIDLIEAFRNTPAVVLSMKQA
jgi:hypothetical protein